MLDTVTYYNQEKLRMAISSFSDGLITLKLFRVIGSQYFYDVICNNYVIGHCEFRLNSHKRVEKLGNIGIIINEEDRNKGYGLRTLRLLLKVAKIFKLETVSITAYKTNLVSQSLINSLNNEMVKEEKESILVYKIKLEGEEK